MQVQNTTNTDDTSFSNTALKPVKDSAERKERHKEQKKFQKGQEMDEKLPHTLTNTHSPFPLIIPVKCKSSTAIHKKRSSGSVKIPPIKNEGSLVTRRVYSHLSCRKRTSHCEKQASCGYESLCLKGHSATTMISMREKEKEETVNNTAFGVTL